MMKIKQCHCKRARSAVRQVKPFRGWALQESQSRDFCHMPQAQGSVQRHKYASCCRAGYEFSNDRLLCHTPNILDRRTHNIIPAIMKLTPSLAISILVAYATAQSCSVSADCPGVVGAGAICENGQCTYTGLPPRNERVTFEA